MPLAPSAVVWQPLQRGLILADLIQDEGCCLDQDPYGFDRGNFCSSSESLYIVSSDSMLRFTVYTFIS